MQNETNVALQKLEVKAKMTRWWLMVGSKELVPHGQSTWHSPQKVG